MIEQERNEMDKFTPVEAFVALLKSFCTLNLLIVPKLMMTEGWLIGVISMLVACGLVMYSSQKLIESAFVAGALEFSIIAHKAFGS